MLFADDLTAAILGGGGMTLLTALGGAAVWWLNRKDRKEKENEQRGDAEEETALARLQRVMDLREEDCERRIRELARRVDDLERNRDARQVERDALRDKLALYSARTKYLEALLKRAGVTPDDWDKPGTDVETLPALDLTPRSDTP